MTLYEAFISEGVPLRERPEFVGGGLIRSLGGWSEVFYLQRKDIRMASDERVIGSSEFVLDLFSEAEKKIKETLKLTDKIKGLEELAQEITEKFKLTGKELRSGGRQRHISRARKLFCQSAVKEMRYPGAEVARFLGVTTSAVSRLANSKEVD